MSKPHFVEDYERHVHHLIDTHPIDEAMSLAVGGNYEYVGDIEAGLLRYAGLHDGMSVFDMGCGSGRLSTALARAGFEVDFTGSDVVQSLLDYAASKAPAHYNFALHYGLWVPMADQSVDFACAFSVFTHLFPEESYIMLADMKRVLRPNGKIVFSFIELSEETHWPAFYQNVENRRNDHHRTPLNQFVERSAITVWAEKLGFRLVEFIDAQQSVGAGALGQAVAIFQKN